MGYLADLNVKDPFPSSATQSDCIKEMYSCGHKCKDASTASNVLGVVVTIVVLSFVVYRYMNKPVVSSDLIAFMDQHEIFKMLIGLLLLSNIRTLSNSLVANIVLPIIKPVLPLISCNLKIKFGLFEIGIGEFISDLLIFLINIYIIFFLFALF